MVKVVIVNGKPSSGKTTFENLCCEKIKKLPIGTVEPGKYLYAEVTSTVDFVKELAFKCGWDGTKTPENRRFLSDLKDLLTHWNDVPFKKIQERVDDLRWAGFNRVIFVDCREPNEIQKLKDAFNATTVIVRRPEVEESQVSNHADADVFYYEYDHIVWNDGDIEKLKSEVDLFLDKYILSDKFDNIYKGERG